MRGQRSLYNKLFSEPVLVKKNENRPRNFYLPERNEAVVYRFYYHATIHNLKYEQCLQTLEAEFYLTSSRLIKVLSESNSMLNRVMHENPKVKDLESKFPHFSWKANKAA